MAWLGFLCSCVSSGVLTVFAQQIVILLASLTYPHLSSVLQFWAHSPKITLCFLNDSITVSLMRAIKMKNVLYFHFQVKQKLKENFEILYEAQHYDCGLWVPTRKQQILLFGSVWHIDTSRGHHYRVAPVVRWLCFPLIKDWKGVMEQTWERLPLYAVPTQTMACASVDGRAGRCSSGLNSCSVSAVGFGCHRDTVGFAREGRQSTAASNWNPGCGVWGWRKEKNEANSAKVIRQLCVERWVVVECKPSQSEYCRNVEVLICVSSLYLFLFQR